MQSEDFESIKAGTYNGNSTMRGALYHEVMEREMQKIPDVQQERMDIPPIYDINRVVEDVKVEERPYDITIKALDYGYIVSAGCQTVAIESVETLLKGLTKYYKNPGNARRDWFSNKEEFLK